MGLTHFPHGVSSFGIPAVGTYEVTEGGKVWFVNSSTGVDSPDLNYGTGPDTPFKTVGMAISQLSDYDTVIIQRDVNETTISSTKNYVSFIGCGPGQRAVRWKSTTATTPCLELQGSSCRVYNIWFEAPTGASAIQITRDATYNAQNTQVYNCEFNTGRIGVESNGGAAGVRIVDCVFHDITSGTTPDGAIQSTSTAIANPKRWIIEHCKFVNNDKHVVLPGNGIIVQGCIFEGQGDSITPATLLDLSGGNGFNYVCGNYFGGTYSHAGGYHEGTSDGWFGNINLTGFLTSLPV